MVPKALLFFDWDFSITISPNYEVMVANVASCPALNVSVYNYINKML